MTEEDSGFSLSGAGGSFSSKSTDIFGHLDTLAEKHDAFLAARAKSGGSDQDDSALQKSDPMMEPVGRSREDSDWPSARDYRDRGNRGRDEGGRREESGHEFRGGFRKPRGLPRRVPDHRINPDRYKHYDLSDVSETSDRGNTAAAFDFLRDRQRLKDEEGMEDDGGADGGKIVFKRPTKEAATTVSSDSKLMSIGGKLTQPEYIIGQKSKKPDRDAKKSSTIASCSKIGLGHLNNEDEEDGKDDQGGKETMVFKKSSKPKSHMRKRVDEEENSSAEKGTKRKDMGDGDEDCAMDVGGERQGGGDGREGRRKKAKPRRFVRQTKGEDSDEDEEDVGEDLGIGGM